jgi:ATP-binding cassette subfamily F protein uup
MAQNPGFLEGTDLGAPPGRTGSEPGLAPRWSDAPPAAPAGAAATDKKGIKLSFKDQRRLEEAERRITEIPREIADLEAGLADPALFGRDPARFSALTRQIDARRDELARAEDDWLALEEKRSPPR